MPVVRVKALVLVFCAILCYHVHLGQDDDDDYMDEEMNAWSEDLKGWPIPLQEKAAAENKSSDVMLRRDSDSGCTCRESPGQWAICFGASCENYPKSLNFSSSSLLRLKTTSIKVILRGDLFNLVEVKDLEIEGNPSLEKLEPGCFEGLISLKTLSISFNPQLTLLEKDTFKGLDSLVELRLTKNGFLHVSDVSIALSPTDLPSLLRLGLSENQFRTIGQYELGPLNGSSVRELSFILCQLEDIHPEAFNLLFNLRVLRLGENSLEPTVLSSLMDSLVSLPLQRLDLYRSGFRRHPPLFLLEAIAKTNITELVLAHNQFERLTLSSFPDMPRLRYLDLRGVVTLNVESSSFFRLPNLRVLLLSHNKLARIEPGVLPATLTALDLSSNSADRLFPSYFNLGEGSFANNTNLTSLNLSFNRLVSLSKGTFLGLDSLEYLSLKNCTLFRLGAKCFSPLKRLKFLDLQNNRFPSTEITIDSMSGMPNLKVLQLGGCGLENIVGSPFAALPSLEYLDISGNALLTLETSVVAPLSSLIGIDLADNILPPWHTTRLFGSNTRLRIMFLANNKLSTLTSEMLNDFSRLNRIDLSGNPFICDCYLFAAKSDLFEMMKISSNESSGINSTSRYLFSRLRSSSGMCFSPDIWRDVSIADFMEKTVATVTCSSSSGQYPSHFNSSRTIPHAFYGILLCLFIIILCFMGCIYRYRWYLRYWMFLARVRKRRSGRMFDLIGNDSISTSVAVPQKNYRYDAFISYSNEDRAFVETLVKTLEDNYPYLRLCVYERDFEIGTVITEAIVESVEMSRRTVLVISDAFVRSQWCMWELRMAQHRIFYDEDFGKGGMALVLVRLGSLSDELITPILRYLMRTRIYLQWDTEPNKQRLFWKRLRAALSPSKFPPSNTAGHLRTSPNPQSTQINSM
ncbi:hypothetical protein J437_LFUL014484 [Ladona fulva]|uniref:TIR domain-containing protein n=1 Tax=Ladona fulva TaxID=123851 RepID=A0A8K0PBA3_LADFU|nr:hypothetical protein J437_LFUL014484 [Ladona fulva]